MTRNALFPIRATMPLDDTLTPDRANSKKVTSDQEGPHPNLLKVAMRHREHVFEKPISEHSRKAFAQTAEIVSQRTQPLILDAGCGTGDSTRRLAICYPEHLVIGVDKSAHRLSRQDRGPLPPNALLIRADLVDFYRLAFAGGWQLAHHFILYPNPWPKSAHLKRRWHGSPVFPQMLALGGRIELRTNWQIYAKEFRRALTAFGAEADCDVFRPEENDYLTLFERKYHLTGQPLYRLNAQLTGRKQT